jgi:UDP-N-acetylglucosamine acyltransferase
MSAIHERAMVSSKAKLGSGNTVGPNAIIEDGVTIGSNNVIGPGVLICNGTAIGNHNHIHAGSIIGNHPQDLSFKGCLSFVRIGNHNTIREYSTIHCGTKENTVTVMGDHCFLMAYSHIAHNCTLGNKVTMVNNATLGGYVVVEEGAFISGMIVVHQFCRIGRLAIIGGLSAVSQDIPPFMMAQGRPATVSGINVVGLRRSDIAPEVRSDIKKAYKLLYRSDLNVTNAIKAIEDQCNSSEVKQLVEFVKNSSRGIAQAGNHRESFE